MKNAEILSALTVKTASNFGLNRELGVKDPGWREVLHAMQGVDPWKVDFMMYVYGGYDRGRHAFYAGLIMEVMQLPQVQAWAEQRTKRSIEAMVLLAIIEWKHWNVKICERDRAAHMGVSLSTWKRKYKSIYHIIMATPVIWETEVMEIVNQRLR